MIDLDNITKYAGYFVAFTLVLAIGVPIIAHLVPAANNSTSGGEFSNATDSIYKNINSGVSLLSTCAVLFGAFLILKAMNII
jgi:hypothetical protein